MPPYGARLGGLTALSEEQIVAFVTHGQPGHGLSLDGLTELSSEQARSLRLFLGPLSLNGLTTLSPEAAEILTCGIAPLPLSQIPVSLNGLRTLAPGVAKALGAEALGGSGPLSLDGLTELSAEDAAALGNAIGPISLNGLVELTPEIVRALNKEHIQRGSLSFNGVKKLSEETARALAELRCDLSLGGVAEISPEVAGALAERNGYRLALGGLKRLSAETAAALARSNSHALILDGLERTSPAVAAALANYPLELSLGGLSSLSPEVAEKLSRHGGDLRLAGLEEITPAAAAALAPHRGLLDLSGLKSVSAEILEALAPTVDISLRSPAVVAADAVAAMPPALRVWFVEQSPRGGNPVRQEQDEVIAVDRSTVEGALAAAGVGGRVDLGDRDAVSVAEAELVAEHRGDVSLDGLTTLPAETAAVLARHGIGMLSLDGLKTLDTDVASALAAKPGWLVLDGVTKIEEVAEEKQQLAFGSILGRMGMNPFAPRPPEPGDAMEAPLPDDVSTLTSLTVEQAKALKRSFSAGNLGGLTELTPEVAEVLSTSEYINVMDLSGLTSLSPDAARALAAGNGYALCLNGLTSLPQDLAEALAAGRGRTLELNGLSEISLDAATALRRKGESQAISLNGLTRLTPEVASALVRYGGTISLNGVTHLSEGVARALLSEEASRQLAEGHSTRMSLDGLTTLSPGVATALMERFKFARKERNPGLLSLNGLTTLSPEVESILEPHRYVLSMDGLEEFPVWWAEEVARRNQGSTKEIRLKKISSEVARRLARGVPSGWRQSYEFRTLEFLTPESARALARFSGEIRFGSLRELDPDVATAFEQHSNTLILKAATECRPRPRRHWPGIGATSSFRPSMPTLPRRFGAFVDSSRRQPLCRRTPTWELSRPFRWKRLANSHGALLVASI